MGRRILLLAAAAVIFVSAGAGMGILLPRVENIAPLTKSFTWTIDGPSPDSAELKGTLSLSDNTNEARTLALQTEVTLSDLRDPPASEDETTAKGKLEAEAHNLSTQAQLLVLFIAFAIASGLAMSVAHSCACDVSTKASASGRNDALAARSSRSDSRWANVVWVCVCAALGALLVAFDPIGPIVSHDVGNALISVFLSERPNGGIITAARGEGIVSDASLRWISIGIVVAGALAGGTVALVLIFFLKVITPNLKKDPSPEQLLHTRKRHVTLVVTLGSTALSLGVALITGFLEWGAGFVSESDRDVIARIAGTGSVYWGSMFTIFALTTSGITGYFLRSDIDAAAWDEAGKTSAEEDAMSRIQRASEWKKNNDLDFDLIKTLSAFVAALGPVLTSAFLNAISKSLA